MTDSREAGSRAVIISSDSHVGPRLAEDLRAYCPKRLLDDFDAFAKAWEENAPVRKMFGSVRTDRDGLVENHDVTRRTVNRNTLTEGGWDAAALLRDMDADGVAADVIFHGLQAGRVDPLPFTGDLIAGREDAEDKELVAAGRHMYNQWLADFVSTAPERHAGLAQLPMWDIPASIKELEWAHSVGLKGVNFPRSRAGLLPYNHPEWEPFWEVCEALDMPLTTHVQGAGVNELVQLAGEGVFAIQLLEIHGAAARQSTHQLVFGGAFRRHPDLKLIFTEQLGIWWPGLMVEMDRTGMRLDISRRAFNAGDFYEGYSELPSDYARHVFVGASCLAPFEAEDAHQEGYASQVMWGSDYPHTEGTWQYPRYDGEPPMTRLALRDTFAALPAEATAAMVGGNAARVYGFDMQALQGVADAIDAPTFGELATPLTNPPEDPATTTKAAFLAFRRSYDRQPKEMLA